MDSDWRLPHHLPGAHSVYERLQLEKLCRVVSVFHWCGDTLDRIRIAFAVLDLLTLFNHVFHLKIGTIW